VAVWPCVSAYISLAYVFPVSPARAAGRRAAGGCRVALSRRVHTASLPGLRSPHSALGLALRFIAYRFIAMHSEVACVCVRTVPAFAISSAARESGFRLRYTEYASRSLTHRVSRDVFRPTPDTFDVGARGAKKMRSRLISFSAPLTAPCADCSGVGRHRRDPTRARSPAPAPTRGG
jgi:hypothetical protein